MHRHHHDDDDHDAEHDDDSHDRTHHDRTHHRRTHHRRGGRVGSSSRRVATAAAALLALAVAGCSSAEGGAADADALELALPGSDAAASCLPFDEGVLAGMAPALAGTVTSVADGAATLEVDRWFAPAPDGEPDAVRLVGGGESSAALTGIPQFEVGERYLLTAADGVVNGCGYSGEATPELEASFERAFG